MSPSKIQGRSLYETDPHAWAMQKAEALRSGRFGDLDLDNLADEIAEMGRGEWKDLRSEVSIILAHMQKWDYQSSHRSKIWADSIDEHRDGAALSLDGSPSLQAHVDEILKAAYKIARRTASRETGLPEARVPADNPYTVNDVMTRKFDLSKDKDAR